jgi:hypothetical protein
MKMGIWNPLLYIFNYNLEDVKIIDKDVIKIRNNQTMIYLLKYI